MGEIYSRELTVRPSQCDFSGKLGYAHSFDLFMDIATEHAEKLGIGLSTLSAKGLFWLTTKSRVRFFRRPSMNERVTVATWPESSIGTRCIRCTRVTRGNEILITGKTEWAVLDSSANSLMDTEDLYPNEFNILDEAFVNDRFEHIPYDFEGDFMGEHTFSQNDIDIGHHVNNVAYLRAFQSIFTCNEWNDFKVKEIEIHYNRPCFESETIRFRSTSAGNTKIVKGSVGDRVAILMHVK